MVVKPFSFFLTADSEVGLEEGCFILVGGNKSKMEDVEDCRMEEEVNMRVFVLQN